MNGDDASTDFGREQTPVAETRDRIQDDRIRGDYRDDTRRQFCGAASA